MTGAVQSWFLQGEAGQVLVAAVRGIAGAQRSSRNLHRERYEEAEKIQRMTEYFAGIRGASTRCSKRLSSPVADSDL